MRKVLVGLATLSLAAGAAITLPGTASAAIPRAQPAVDGAEHTHGSDDLSSPQQDKARALRQEALTRVLNGEAKVQERNGSQVVKMAGRKGKADDKYVELAREQTDRIFVVLAEFGDQRHPDYPDQDTDPDFVGPTVFDGPLHNKIPAPGKDDNTTVWQKDYSQKHYQDLYFGEGKGVESLKTYYETQSSGRYSVEGTVTDWVKLPYNEARYGRSNGYPCPDTICENTWEMVTDGLKAWVADQKAKGRPTRRSRPRSPSSTSGTATTSTGTATSTSRTATSTTSRSSTPAATRPTRTRSRVRTRSGATAGTPTSTRPARPARRTTSWAAPRSATPASGSATTPRSPRTAG